MNEKSTPKVRAVWNSVPAANPETLSGNTCSLASVKFFVQKATVPRPAGRRKSSRAMRVLTSQVAGEYRIESYWGRVLYARSALVFSRERHEASTRKVSRPSSNTAGVSYSAARLVVHFGVRYGT